MTKKDEIMKNYKMVHERIIDFNNDHKNGSIKTEITIDKEWNNSITKKQCTCYIVEARVYPDADQENRYFSGHAYETDDDGFINRKNALENCETSAVGRALSMAGYIGQEMSIATQDVIDQAKKESPARATTKQIEHLTKLQREALNLKLISLKQFKEIDQRKSTLDLIGYSDAVIWLDDLIIENKKSVVITEDEVRAEHRKEMEMEDPANADK